MKSIARNIFNSILNNTYAIIQFVNGYDEKSLPRVRIAPTNFCFDKECGDFSTWNAYGLWVNKLLQGRDELPINLQAAIKDLVRNAKTDKEKVEILYKYLQNNSRYVSIQLGIGGLQPILAESTMKNNYGDCKGLSNLMKAMLKVVGIPSNYTEIHQGSQKRLIADFSDVQQTNHVILLVPLENDSIWLECTSNSIPMGYIHPGIVGHDALVIGEEGGTLCKLPSYGSEENLQESVISMTIAENGSVEGHLSFVEHLHGFGTYHSTLKSNDRTGHISYINSRVNFPKINIGKISTSEVLSELPSCSLDATFTTNDYVTKTGQRLFIPMLPIKKGIFNAFRARERVHDIVITVGFSEKDSIVFDLPEGYEIENLPKSRLLVSDYGSASLNIEKLSDSKISCSSYIDIPEGKYSKEEYPEIKDFFQKIAAFTKTKMVIRKTVD